jgi:hypothetical protein
VTTSLVARAVPVAEAATAHPDVAADQRQGPELAERPSVEPVLGGHGMGLRLPDQVQPLLEPSRPEPARAGEQVSRRRQVTLDQPGLALACQAITAPRR